MAGTNKSRLLEGIRQQNPSFTDQGNQYDWRSTQQLEPNIQPGIQTDWEKEKEFWSTRAEIEGEDSDWQWYDEGISSVGRGSVDFVTHGLWNLADTAMFGALDWMDIDHLLWGAEYGGVEGGGTTTNQFWGKEVEGVVAEGFGAKAGAAVGGLLGYVAPVPWAPLKVGSAAAGAVARTGAKVVGKRTLPGVLAKAEKAAIGKKAPKYVNESAFSKVFNKEMQANMRGLNAVSKTDKAFGASAKDFAYHAGKRVDDLVANVARRGGSAAEQKVAKSIGGAYKKYFADPTKKIPIQDFYDIVGHKFGKYSYGIASILLEATMFGTIDALAERFHSWDEERDYDWSHLKWGAITGSLFGTLKFPFFGVKGKSSSTWQDFQQGLRGAFALTGQYKKMNLHKLRGNARIMGNNLKNVMKDGTPGNFINYKLPAGLGKGETVQVNLADPETMMTTLFSKVGLLKKGTDPALKNAFEKEVLSDILIRTSKQHGKDLMKYAVASDLKSSRENWLKMVLGATFMNAHTIHEMRKGTHVEPEDILISVLLGAYLNRKGMPATRDVNLKNFDKNIDNLRKGMSDLGIETKNMYDIPTLDPRNQPGINSFANDPKLKKIFNEFKDNGGGAQTVEEMVTSLSRISPGTQSVGVWAPGQPEPVLRLKGSKHDGKRIDMQLWKEVRREFPGASDGKLIKVDDAIPLELAINVQEKLKNIGIKSVEDFANYRDAVISSKVDVFKSTAAQTVKEVLEIDGGLGSGQNNVRYKLNEVSEGYIGKIPQNIAIGQYLKKLAKKGDLKDILTGKRNQSDQLDHIEAQLNNLLRINQEMFNAKTDFNRVYIGDKVDHQGSIQQLKQIKTILDNNAQILNTRLQVLNPRFEFDWANTYGAERQIQARLVQNEVKRINDFMDVTKDTQRWPETFEVMRDSKILHYADGVDQIISNPKLIKWSKSEQWNPGEKARASELLTYVHDILSLKGQHVQNDLIGSQSQPVYVTKNAIEKLETHLRRYKIPNDSQSINSFGPELKRRISAAIIEKSNLLDGDINALSSLAATSQTSRYTKAADSKTMATNLVSIKRSGAGLGGFAIAELRMLHPNKTAQAKVTEFNEWVNRVVESGSGYVSKKEKYFLTNPDHIDHILKEVKKSYTATNLKAQEQMHVFLNGLDPEDPGRKISMAYLNQHKDDAQTMLKWMVDLGIMKMGTKSVDGKLENTNFKFNQKAWSSADIQQKWKDRLGTFGLDSKAIDAMYHERAMGIDAEIDKSFGRVKDYAGIKDEISFFDKHFPAPEKDKRLFASGFTYYKSLETPESRNLYIKNKLDKGAQGIKEIVDEVQAAGFQPGQSRESVRNDIVSLYSTRMNGRSVPEVSYVNGDTSTRSANATKTRSHESLLDIVGPYAYVKGEVQQWGKDANRKFAYEQTMDIFAANERGLDSYTRKKYRDTREAFELRLENSDAIENLDVGMQGFGIVELSPKTRIAVDKSFAHKNTLNKYIEMKEKYKKSLSKPEFSEASKKIDNMIELLQKNDRFVTQTNQAIRDLVYERMLYSDINGKELFLEYMNQPQGSKKLSNIIKRFSLFDDNKTRKIDSRIDDYLSKEPSLRMRDKRLVNTYRRKVDKDGDQVFNIATYNDNPAKNLETSNKDSWNLKMSKLAKDDPRYRIDKNDTNSYYSWEFVHGNTRGTESGFDSITKISPKFARYLQLHYGVEGSNIFKPVINSGGKGELLLYGKTAFFVDPALNKFWKNNPEIDILMASSADKLSSIPEASLINSAIGELNTISGVKYHSVKSKRLGILKAYSNDIITKNSPSIFNNYMNTKEAGLAYDAYFSKNLQEGAGLIKRIFDNDLELNYVVNRLLGGDRVGNSLELSTEYSDLNLMRISTELAPYASPSTYDRAAVIDLLKNKFIEPAIRPNSYIEEGGRRYMTGGKSVLMQPFNVNGYKKKAADGVEYVVPGFNDLDPTIINPRTNELVQRGQVYLPAEMGNKDIRSGSRDDFKVWVNNNKTNEVFEAKTLLKELTGLGKKEFDNLWETIPNLRLLHEAFRSVSGNDYDLLVRSMRWPRTRPNDMMFLRVKDFIHPEYGNGTVVNKHDVYNVFEGDYDIDTIELSWLNPKVVRDHMIKQEGNYITPVNVEDISKSFANVELGSIEGKYNEQQWSTAFQDVHSMKKMVGQVQGVTAQVNHVWNLFPKTKNKATGFDEAVVVQGKNGNKVVMDWDVNQWFYRTALEGQVVLDASGQSPNVAKSVLGWRKEYLFPDYQNSYSRKDFTNPDGTPSPTIAESNFKQMQKSAEMPDAAKKRIRIFRHIDKNGTEIGNVPELAKDIIMEVMKQHGYNNLAYMRDKVYTAGKKVAPTYEMYVNAHKENQKFYSNPTEYVFKKLNKMTIRNADGTSSNVKKYDRNKADGRALLSEYFNLEQRVFEDSRWKRPETLTDKDKYWWFNDKTTLFKDKFDALNEMKRRIDSNEGSVAERIIRTIAAEDPLSIDYQPFMTGKDYARMQFVESKLLGDTAPDVQAVVNAIPTAIKTLNDARNKVNNLYSLQNKISKDPTKSYQDKQNVNKKLQEKIDKVLEDPKFKNLVYKQWTSQDYGNKKLLPKIKTIDVARNRDMIEDLVQRHATDIKKFFKPNNHEGMLDRIKEDKLAKRELYGERDVVKKYNDFQGKGVRNLTEREKIAEIGTKTYAEKEADLDLRMIKGINDYGLSYLLHYMSPAQRWNAKEITLGMYEGQVVTTSGPVEYGNTSYKRGKKFMLRAIAGETKVPNVEAQTFKDLYQRLSSVEYYWSQYYKGNFREIDSMDQNGLFRIASDPTTKGVGTFTLHPKARQFLGNFADIRWNQPVNETNPFGMGRKYNNTFRFLRSLYEGTDKAIAFEEFHKKFSYLHQIMAENGGMDPIVHMAVMKDLVEKLGPEITKNSFPAQIDVNTGKVKPTWNAALQQSPMFALLGKGQMNGSSGIGIDMPMISKSHLSSLKKIISQSKDMSKITSNKFSRLKEERVTSVKKGKRDSNGKIC